MDKLCENIIKQLKGMQEDYKELDQKLDTKVIQGISINDNEIYIIDDDENLFVGQEECDVFHATNINNDCPTYEDCKEITGKEIIERGEL